MKRPGASALACLTLAVLGVCALAILLAGCVPQTANLNAEIAKLASVAVTDINAAAADAGAHGDVLAAACYPALANWVISLQQHGQIVPLSGAFSAFQATRDIYKGSNSGIPTSVKLGCAALYLDAKGDIVQFVAMLAAIATGRFVPPALP